MRIGSLTPRINGLSIGIGTTPDLSGIISSYLNSFLNNLGFDIEQGTAATPSTVQQTLTQAVKDACASAQYNGATSCPDMSSALNSAVATYTTAYNAAKADFQANVQAGLISAPLPIQSYNFPATPTRNDGPLAPPDNQPVAPVASPSQVQYSTQPSNALDRVVPHVSTVVRSTPGNVLAPPQASSVPVSNSGSFTGTSTVSANPGVTDTSTPLGIPTWALLGAAALGLFLMVKGK